MYQLDYSAAYKLVVSAEVAEKLNVHDSFLAEANHFEIQLMLEYVTHLAYHTDAE